MENTFSISNLTPGLTLNCCLLRHGIPVELRQTLIIQTYLYLPLRNSYLRKAAIIWCIGPHDENKPLYDSLYSYYHGHISDWNMSEVTNMSGLFKGYSHFNDDITRWDVSRVKNMTNLFHSAISFNQCLN